MFGSLPRVPPQKCRFERPLAERRKTGTDLVKPLDTFSVPAASSYPGWSVTTGEVDLVGDLVVTEPAKGWVPKAAAGVLPVLHVADQDRP